MKSFAIAMALGSTVLLGGTAAKSNPVNANAETGLSQATDFSSQHHGGGHRTQRTMRSSHESPHHGRRRVHSGAHGGGHGGGAPGITIGVGSGGHRGSGHGGGGPHR